MLYCNYQDHRQAQVTLKPSEQFLEIASSLVTLVASHPDDISGGDTANLLYFHSRVVLADTVGKALFSDLGYLNLPKVRNQSAATQNS